MIYVLCPANIKTGGTELLHQLVFELNKNDINAIIVYEHDKENVQTYAIPEEFKIYTSDYLISEQIIDNKDNVLIVPETFTYALKRYKNLSIYIWWLSVDNYMWINVYDPIWHFRIFKNEYGIIRELLCILKRAIQYRNSSLRPIEIKSMNKEWRHLVQSYYAKDFLEKHGISNVEWLSDYINIDYLSQLQETDVIKKENYVAYNPNKGMRFTKKIIRKCSNIKFVPIINMTNSEVINCLKKAKVYIDFGRHSGKDRIPREAACLHCCVLTGVRGAAAYEDVLIDEEFKIKDSAKNIKYIQDLIISIFNSYDEYDHKYDEYRKEILLEKELFQKKVREIFC